MVNKHLIDEAHSFIASLARRYDGIGPLTVCIGEDRMDVLLLIIQSGYDVNIPQDFMGCTALEAAILTHKNDFVVALLAAGASIEMVPGAEARPPLHAAAASLNAFAFGLLLALGADLAALNYCGMGIDVSSLTPELRTVFDRYAR